MASGPAYRAPRHVLPRAAMLALGLLAVATASAQGTDALGPRGPAVLPHTGSECLQVPNCLAVGGERAVVGVDRLLSVALACPTSHPYVWHWDTEQHAHIATKVVGRTRGALTFSLVNQGEQPGDVRILIGCSAQPFDVRAGGAQYGRTGARPRGAPISTGTAR